MRFLILGAAMIVLVAAFVAGIQLARSNADIPCWQTSSTREETGACTGGSWGAWSTVSQSGGNITETRTYTGFRNTLYATISYNTCTGITSGSGAQITSKFAACQIQETRVRPTGGSAGTGSGSGAAVVRTTRTETTGAFDESRTTRTSGSYQLFLDMVDAQLATSAIFVSPSIVRQGDRTNVIWTSDHVRSCVVTAANGDRWEGLDSPEAGERSSPITQQTVYTLTCTTALGTQLINQATVDVLPVFEEQ